MSDSVNTSNECPIYLCKLCDYDNLSAVEKFALMTDEQMKGENLVFTIADAQMSKVQLAGNHNGSCRLRWFRIGEMRQFRIFQQSETDGSMTSVKIRGTQWVWKFARQRDENTFNYKKKRWFLWKRVDDRREYIGDFRSKVKMIKHIGGTYV